MLLYDFIDFVRFHTSRTALEAGGCLKLVCASTMRVFSGFPILPHYVVGFNVNTVTNIHLVFATDFILETLGCKAHVTEVVYITH